MFLLHREVVARLLLDDDDDEYLYHNCNKCTSTCMYWINFAEALQDSIVGSMPVPGFSPVSHVEISIFQKDWFSSWQVVLLL